MSSSSADPLNNRVDFKLNAASRRLENLRQLEANSAQRNLASTKDRMQVEMETDEFLYHLVGVKDALLQEINRELHLGLAESDVTLGKINGVLNQRGAAPKDITKEIDDMVSDEKNPLCW